MSGNVGHSFALAAAPNGASASHTGLASNGTAGNNTVISGYRFSEWIDTTGVQYVTWRNCWFSATNAAGSPIVKFADAPGVRFENCTFSVGTAPGDDMGAYVYSSDASHPVVFQDCAFLFVQDCIKLGPNITVNHSFLAAGAEVGQHGDALQADGGGTTGDNLILSYCALTGGNDSCLYPQSGGNNISVDHCWMAGDSGPGGSTSYIFHMDAATNASITNCIFDPTLTPGGNTISATSLAGIATTWSGNVDQNGNPVARP
jgi:hypothetical protein